MESWVLQSQLIFLKTGDERIGKSVKVGVEVFSGLAYIAVTQESSGEVFPGLAYTAVTQESGRQEFSVGLFSPGSMT